MGSGTSRRSRTLRSPPISRRGPPRFLQTAKAYVINLTKVTAFSFSSARDLWFEGADEPVVNAVTDHYLDAFVEALPH